MSEETIGTIVDTGISVNAATAEARGDNFTPTNDELVLDNNGDSIDTTTTAPAPSPAPAAPAPAPAAPTADEADELERQNGGRIPKARFNEVNNARKFAEERANLLAAEIERLKTQPAATPAAPAPAPAPAVPAFDMKAQERAYADAMLEGDVDNALEIREQINAHILSTAEENATRRVTAHQAQQSAVQTLQQASDKAVTDFPYLDTPEGADALDLIILARDKAVAAGKPMHIALQEAVAKIAPKFAPAGTQTPSSGLPANAPAVDTRSANAIARGAADSNLQPPAIANGIGNRATEGKLDIANLTEAQFEALTPEEKKKARGD